MSSNLECVGLGVRDHEDLGVLVQTALTAALPLAEFSKGELWRWQDRSGARLTITLDEHRQVKDMLPSFDGLPGARLVDVRAINAQLARATVVDENSEPVTSMVFAAEQQPVLRDRDGPVSGLAVVTALAVDVTVYPDEATFAASEDSVLDLGPGASAATPPEEYVRNGWAWPPRLPTQSFTPHSHGDDAKRAKAQARMSGVVLGSERRACGLTGQEFMVARVETTGFELDMCFAAFQHPEQPPRGAVVVGTVFLVGSIDWLVAPESKPWRRGTTRPLPGLWSEHPKSKRGRR
jgi:hypothetical protein